MENASKALLMAVAILIGIIILSSAVYLINSYITFARNYEELRETNKMEEFNAKFIAYSRALDKKDDKWFEKNGVTMQEILSLVNIAKDFNDSNGVTVNESQYIKVKVKVGNASKDTIELTTATNKEINSLLDGTYNNIFDNYNDIFPKCYYCSEYNINPYTGRIDSIFFKLKDL